MTQTIYIIKERENNGEWAVQAEYKTRKEALATISKILGEDESADPQDFMVVERENVDYEGTLNEAAKKVADGLSIFLKKFKTSNYIADNNGWIEMVMQEKYPFLSCVAVRKLCKELDEFNEGLPEGYEVFFAISHECAIRLFLSTPKKEEEKDKK